MATDRLVDAMQTCGLTDPSWDAWKVVAKVMDGLPLDRDEQRVFELCTGRTRVPTERPAEIVLIKGRRCGGSRYGGVAATRAAAKRYRLAPGEQAVIGLAAADKEQCRVLLGYATSPFRETDELRGLMAPRSSWDALRSLVSRETRWGVDLKTGATIEVRAANFKSVRGRSYALAVADEVAFWMSEDGSNPASEVLTAIRPGLSTLRGQLLIITTPFLKSGPVWDLFTKYYGKDDARTLVWRATSQQMNPLLDDALVADALERDPESAQSEWLAQFRDDAGALVTDAALRAVVAVGRGLLAPSTESRYAIVVDNATGSGQDSLAMAVGHLEIRHGVPIAVIDGVAEAKPPFNPVEAVMQIGAFARDYGVDCVFGDRVGQGWCEPIYAQASLRYEPLGMTKSELYLAGLALINARQIELPDEPRLLAQIAGLQRKPTAAGHENVDHAPRAGAHDDLANVALGVAALLQRGGIPEPVRLW